MKKWLPLLLMSLTLLLGCDRDNVSHKFIEGLPILPNQSVLQIKPIQQQHILLKEGAGQVVAIINRLTLISPNFNELSGPDNQSRYQFQTHNKRTGTATFTLQFFEDLGVVIDPISVLSSSTTLNFVQLTTSGQSEHFSYTQNLTITLNTRGNVQSEKRLTGSGTFTGSGISLTFTYASPGVRLNFQGPTRGEVTGSGTGPGTQPISTSFSYQSDHSLDGTLNWEGHSGNLHLEDDSSGFIVTETHRLPIE